MAKPYSLSGEATPALVEQLDEMLRELYARMDGTGHAVLSASHTDVVEATKVRGDLLSVQGVTGELYWKRLAVGAANSVLAADGTDATWTTAPTVVSLTATTRVTTPAITTTAGALTITPVAGSGVAVVLSTTGDFTVNTTGFVVDTSSGAVGIGVATPLADLHIQHASANVDVFLRSGAGSGFNIGVNSTPTLFLAKWDGATYTDILQINSGGTIDFKIASTLGLVDTNASHYLRLNAGSDLTADRILSFVTGDAARTITLSGNPTLTDWFDQSVKVAASPTFTNVTLSEDLIFSGTNKSIHQSTSDGSDNRSILMGGGGAIADSRGAYFALYGNEAALPGSIGYQLGNVAGANFDIAVGGGVSALNIVASGNSSFGVNLGVGGSGTWGTSAAKVLRIDNGTEPTTSPADMIQLYSVDLSAGNATLGLRTETAVVTEAVGASDRTLSVKINGTTYKIMLHT